MRIFDAGGGHGPLTVTSRVATVPNVVTVLRLAALPFIWHSLVTARFWQALVLIAVFAATDWIDGYLARRLDQVTRLGQLLDPLADRALLAVTAIAMVVAGVLPWWAVAAVVVRDLIVLLVAAVLVAGPSQAPPVTRLGKTATAGLFVALPMFVAASGLGHDAGAGTLLRGAAWVTFALSASAYWVAALDYARRLSAGRRAGRGDDDGSTI